ncbi:MAG TPA: antibiotic biosynthesis monooxygenase family protein [Thermoanaerobaculia bacterium]
MADQASRAGASFTVLVVFTVGPGKASDLVAKVQNLMEGVLTSEPGFVSAAAYKSEDDGEVVTVTTWRERRDFEAFRQKPNVLAGMMGGLEYQPKIHFLREIARLSAR